MMALLLEPLQFTFMSHALLIGLSGPERLGTDG